MEKSSHFSSLAILLSRILYKFFIGEEGFIKDLWYYISYIAIDDSSASILYAIKVKGFTLFKNKISNDNVPK
jgi:hypothetical protein